MRKLLIAGLSSLIVAGSATVASAAVVTWTTWTSASTGTAGPIGLTYAGPAVSLETPYPSYDPTSTFADGSVVNNAPVPANGILKVSDQIAFGIQCTRTCQAPGLDQIRG